MPTMIAHVRDNIPDAVYIGRRNARRHLEGSPFQNPFKMGVDGSREQVIEKFRRYLLGKPDLVAQVKTLKGKTLACWCRHLGEVVPPCHGDILAALADEQVEPEAHVYQVQGVDGWYVCLQAEEGCYQTTDFGPFPEEITRTLGEQLLQAWRHGEITLIDMEDWH